MDFAQILNLLNAGSTGTLISLILALASFVSSRKGSERRDEQIDQIHEYISWLRQENNKELLEGQKDLIVAIEGYNEDAKIIRSWLLKLIRHVEHHTDILSEIIENTKRIPDMDYKLDYLIEQLSQKDTPGLQKGQVAVCAKVLDKLSKGIIGSGLNVMMDRQLNIHAGTVIVVWLLGTKSPHMMLLDCVGSIYQNRISLILNNNASISLQAYDCEGGKTVTTSRTFIAGEHLVIFGLWNNKNISLWVNGENQGFSFMNNKFSYLGPLCLFGIDIEGKLSADAVRWTPPGLPVGLNFQKDGIWHGSRYDTVHMFDRVLNEEQIAELSTDPWVMFSKSENTK